MDLIKMIKNFNRYKLRNDVSARCMMEIRQLISFITIAQCESFTKAADKLGYSQSAITIQIKNLETELSTRLFDRIGKKVILTGRGREFMRYANMILDTVNQSKLSMGTEELVHQVHIGVNESLCFARFHTILPEIRALHPKMTVKITLDTPGHLIELMENGELDLIYILDRPRFEVSWVKIFEKKEDIVFVCNSSLEIAQKPPGTAIPFEEILKYPFILTEKGANYRFAFDNYLSRNGFELQTFLEISDTEFIAGMLEETDCISLLPYFVVEQKVKEGRMSVLSVPDFQTTMYSQVIYHKNKWVTGEMKEIIRLLKELT